MKLEDIVAAFKRLQIARLQNDVAWINLCKADGLPDELAKMAAHDPDAEAKLNKLTRTN